MHATSRSWHSIAEIGLASVKRERSRADKIRRLSTNFDLNSSSQSTRRTLLNCFFKERTLNYLRYGAYLQWAKYNPKSATAPPRVRRIQKTCRAGPSRRIPSSSSTPILVYLQSIPLFIVHANSYRSTYSKKPRHCRRHCR